MNLWTPPRPRHFRTAHTTQKSIHTHAAELSDIQPFSSNAHARSSVCIEFMALHFCEFLSSFAAVDVLLWKDPVITGAYLGAALFWFYMTTVRAPRQHAQTLINALLRLKTQKCTGEGTGSDL